MKKGPHPYQTGPSYSFLRFGGFVDPLEVRGELGCELPILLMLFFGQFLLMRTPVFVGDLQLELHELLGQFHILLEFVFCQFVLLRNQFSLEKTAVLTLLPHSR